MPSKQSMIIFAGRTMIIRPLESFECEDILYSPVDVIDVHTGMKAQAIVETHRVYGNADLINDNRIKGAVKNAYGNAMRSEGGNNARWADKLDNDAFAYVMFRAIPAEPRPVFRSIYRAQGRNGYTAIERFTEDPDYPAHCPATMCAYLIAIASRKKSEQIVNALNEAFALGTEFGAYIQKTEGK